MAPKRSSKASNSVPKSTRATKQAQSVQKPLAAGREADRLQIDGTAALGFDNAREKAPAASGRTYSSKGASWVDVDAPVPPFGSRKRKRRVVEARDEAPIEDAGDERDGDADKQFLDEARRQLKRSKRDDCREIVRYLRRIEPATHLADAHIVSVEQARRLLQGDRILTAPVFVAHAANTAGILAPESDERPVEQLLAWFHDPTEHISRGKELGQIRQRFVANRRPSGTPWNFPDTPNPFHHSGIPLFLQDPSCNVLADVVRGVFDISAGVICTDACTNERTSSPHCCNEHLTQAVELKTGWRQWSGAIMFAEAGAVTEAHWDYWGFSTWVTCLEGEMGLGFLPDATEADRIALLEQRLQPDNRWRYRFLRPEDTVYFSGGTPHLFFRLPEGRQTAGLGGHIVRRPDVESWIRLNRLRVEVEEREGANLENADVYRALVIGIDHWLEQVKPKGLKRIRAELKRLRTVVDRL
ncbi:hypothetical protein BAUCODRAFT_503931 [Baudoinia panamericana UAMH 10762]|uniref:JmjC domain-containing protein n=1 Tax=Baudoinia panamericana (strain UAMH 10762) TaxID=717646 RepID=M2N9K0_BAUPA|nr:uncharacterized protein BAUCODRAFT_503931 [Baudoinia panamericana UAMH 10762]EMC95794.1 hypothetical protein BAUCODRAFT_503931 [Baudoinia panamericana UAMH 10762]